MASTRRLAPTLREWWLRPSRGGVILTIAGMMMLALDLTFIHVLPHRYQIHNLLEYYLLWAFVYFQWALYVIGGALVLLGVFKGVAIDTHRSPW